MTRGEVAYKRLRWMTIGLQHGVPRSLNYVSNPGYVVYTIYDKANRHLNRVSKKPNRLESASAN